jgi:hypothetical protein
MDYDKLAALAKKLVTKFGAACTVLRDGTKVASGYAVAVSRTLEDESASPTSAQAQSAAPKRTMVLTLSAAPLVGDQLKTKKETLLITSVTEAKPADTVLTYRVTLK